MSPDSTTFNLTLQRIGAGAIFVAVVTGGVLVLLYFWSQLLRPGNLNAFSLPLVAFIAGVAATFNPCGMPALPGFLAFGGGGGIGVGRRAGLGLGASLGAMSLLIALGIIVAALGAGTKDLIAPKFPLGTAWGGRVPRGRGGAAPDRPEQPFTTGRTNDGPG